MIALSTISDILRTCSPSGFEGSFKSLIHTLVSPLVDRCTEDVHGNLICYKHAAKNSSDKTIMFVAHMDEVGLMVSFIEDSGYIRFTRIGGVDLLLLKGRNVKIIHDGEEILGIIGAKPFHMKKNGENKDLDESDLWIDIGVYGKEEVEKLIAIGDSVVIDAPVIFLPNNLVISRGCDNKAGVIALVCMLESIKDAVLKSDIVVVFSVQEEVGFRGARTASYLISPDICIAVDVAHATDYPTVNKSKYGDVKIGCGPVIPLGSDLTLSTQKKLKTIADNSKIPFQQLAFAGSSGTDANVVQVTKSGCATGLISIPCRYMHTPVEVVSIMDIESVSTILTGFCNS